MTARSRETPLSLPDLDRKSGSRHRGAAAGETDPRVSPGTAVRVPGETRDPPRTPAGAADAADAAAPAGSRTWTIELPAGLKLLSLNGRVHWAERHRRNQAIKDAATVMTRKARVPPLERVSVVAEYQPPDRRRRDADNIMAAAKSAIDGIVAAGVVAGDDSRYVSGVTCRIGEPFPHGRLVLHVTDDSGVVKHARRTPGGGDNAA